MRRKLNSNFIFYVFLVALFTLMSYLFDQLVIREEDKFRISEIKYQNLIEKNQNLYDVKFQIDNIVAHTSSYLHDKLIKRNYNYKSYMKLNIPNKSKIYEKDFTNTDIDIIRSNHFLMIEEFKIISLFSNNMSEKVQDIFYWNEKVYPEFTNILNQEKNNLIKSYSDFENLFKKNLDKFIYKKFDIYNENKIDLENTIDFKIENWQDLNRFQILILENINSNNEKLNNISLDIERIAEDQTIVITNNFENLKKISNLKNQLILLSIIFQILSLLALLFLFRNLILNVKRI